MASPQPKWKIEVLERIKEYSNLELINETLSLAGGDDYDGCYTDRGWWTYDMLQRELTERLQGVGYISVEERIELP